MATLATTPELGKHLTAVTITPQTVSAAGVFSDTTPVINALATIENIALDLTANLEEISALTSVRDNNVITSDAYSISLQVFKVNGSTDPDKLKNAFFTADYFKIAYTEGTVSGGIKTTTAYAVRGNYSGGFQGKGKQIATASFMCVDAGSDSIVVS
jgi:hypothetical protein